LLFSSVIIVVWGKDSLSLDVSLKIVALDPCAWALEQTSMAEATFSFYWTGAWIHEASWPMKAQSSGNVPNQYPSQNPQVPYRSIGQRPQPYKTAQLLSITVPLR
jgi:hypothetical protein